MMESAIVGATILILMIVGPMIAIKAMDDKDKAKGSR
jgi:hypothetical protein